MIGSESGGILGPVDVDVELDGQGPTAAVRWALLAANFPGAHVRSFCLPRIDCEPGRLQQLGLLTGEWDTFLLFPGARIASSPRSIPPILLTQHSSLPHCVPHPLVSPREQTRCF